MNFFLSASEKSELSAAFQKELIKNPPTIGLVGVSGTGKSSTINTLFKTKLPISHTTACTKAFEASKIALRQTQGEAIGQETVLTVYDAPGLGEDIEKDPEYIEMYQQQLPRCDVILWVMTARNRAIALDQMYLLNFRKLFDRIVFGINQVDLISPLNWPNGLPIPSVEQESNLNEIVADRTRRLSKILEQPATVIPYSNMRGFNLEGLFAGILNKCQSDRAWMFGGLKNFSYKDFMPKNAM